MTNKRKVMLTLFCLIGYLVVFCQTETPALWYSKPAKTWTEALPVGNGRLGAMIYGDYLHENIQLNEESVWAGSKTNNNNPQARAGQ